MLEDGHIDVKRDRHPDQQRYRHMDRQTSINKNLILSFLEEKEEDRFYRGATHRQTLSD